MRQCWKRLLAYAAALCVSLTWLGIPVSAEPEEDRLYRGDLDTSAEITRVECCGSMTPQYVEVGTPLEDLSFNLSVWFEGEEDASGYYHVNPEEITGYDPSEGVKDLTISVTIHGKPYEFHTDVTVLSPEQYQEHEDIHWFIWCYYMHMLYADVSWKTANERFENWTVGNFNYDGQITPENVDTLFTHAYFTEYFANGSDFWEAYHDDETNYFIIPRADMEKLFTKAFTGSPEGLTTSSMYHPDTDTFEYDLQGYGGGGPGHYTYEKTLDSDGNTVIRFIPESVATCAHCYNPTYTCCHNIELVLAPDGRMVSIKLMPREIQLENSPRTTYQAGEAFDVEGATIRVVYDDKRYEAVPLTADMVSGYDPDKIGRQTLTVTYGGQSVTFDVTVAAGEAADETIGWTSPSHTLYEQGEPLDVSDAHLTIGYGEDSRDIPLTADMVSGYDPDKIGRQTLTVSYQGKVLFTYEVDVLSPEDFRIYRFEEIIRCCYCFSGFYNSVTNFYRGPDWHPDFMRFTGKLTEANKQTFFLNAWFQGNGFQTDFEVVDQDLLPAPEGLTGSSLYGYFFKVSADDMRQILDTALVYDEDSLTSLSYYHQDTDCFLIPFAEGWGGGPMGLDEYATITQKENGNWLIQQRKPSPEAGIDQEMLPGYLKEIYQFDAEFTEDYRLVYFEIIMEDLSWKTAPEKTTYSQGEPLDLTGGVLTAHHGTGKTFDIPLTADMVSGYDPEKTGKQTLTATYGGRSVTFDVTVTASETEEEPPIAVDDEETGIKLETAGGVVPPDTVIQAKPVTEGGNFTIINDALAQTSHKWVAYDIRLLSDNVEIQPNGKVQITMPVPKGLNKNKMALFHVAEDGKLTQIPFTLDKTKDHLVFETDHFSLYVVAETSETDSESSNPPTGYAEHGIILLALLLMAGTAVLLLRKQQTAR